MHTEIETALRATCTWVMTRFYGSEMPASLASEFFSAHESLDMAAAASKRERARLERSGFGIEALKHLQFAVEDAGLWAAYAKGAPSLTGRAYDLDSGLAIAGAL